LLEIKQLILQHVRQKIMGGGDGVDPSTPNNFQTVAGRCNRRKNVRISYRTRQNRNFDARGFVAYTAAFLGVFCFLGPHFCYNFFEI
jgi:hypothetical protein